MRVRRLFSGRLSAVALAAGVLACATSAMGQAEVCANAGLHPISLGVPFSGNFTGSTNDGPTGCVPSSTGVTQWAVFTAPATARYMISMCASQHADTHLGISLASEACSGAITYIACNDDACGLGSQVVVDLTQGETYRLRIGTWGASITNGGAYTVLITQQSDVAPANDECSTATVATVGANSGNNNGATGFDSTTCGGTNDFNDVFYVFTAAADGLYRFAVCTDEFDAVLSVHSACPADSFNQIGGTAGCAESAGTIAAPAISCTNKGASIQATLFANDVVYIRVAGNSSQILSVNPGTPQSGFGNFTVNVSFIAAPANDDCANAEVITSLPFSATVDNLAANSSGLLGGCDRAFDVWYAWTANADGAVTLNETGGQDSAWAVYEGVPCDGSISSLLCTLTDSGVSVFPVFNGTTYYFRLGANSATVSRTTPLQFNIQFTPAPANDVCDDAVVLDVLAGGSVTVDARAAQNDDDIDCNGATAEAVAGVWYTFTTGPNPGVVVINETSTATVATQFYTGDCNSLVPVFGSCSTAQARNFAVQPNTTYYMIMSMSAATRPGVAYAFTYQFLEAPANDLCENATVVDIVAGGSFLGNGIAASDETIDVTCNAGSVARLGVWYTFTAPWGGTLTVSQTAGLDTFRAFFTGDCGSLNQISCVDVESSSIEVVGGETYYVLVGMWSTTTVPTVPYNMNFSFVAVVGACCNGSNCTVVPEQLCLSGGGTYVGDGTSCALPAGMPADYGPNNPGLPIGPDLGVITEDAITVSGGPTSIGRVEVDVDLTHTFVGDLTIDLISPSGTNIRIFNRLCSLNDNINATFSDAGVPIVCGTNPAVSGTVLPANPLNGFNTQDANGTWTLRITDNAGLDGGTLLSWGMSIDASVPACSGGPAPCPGNFNGDGTVDLLDLLAFNAAWSGSLGQNVTPGTGADLNNDGIVDLLDLLAFNAAWSSNLGNNCP